MVPPDPLEALRAAGAARQQAAQTELTTEQHLRARAALAAGKRATSAVGWVANPDWGYVVGSLAVASLAMGAATAFGKLEEPRWVAVGGVLLAALMLIAIGLATLAVRSSVGRELAWANGLPFPVLGHLEHYPDSDCRFTIQFKGHGPGRELLQELLAGITEASLELDLYEGQYELRMRHGRETSDRHHWRVWHQVTEKLLVPVDAKWPIASVTFAE